MLKIQDLTITYPDKTKAVDNLSLQLNKNESIALIGENGAGKTTLMLALVGILEPSNGTVDINGIMLNKKTVNETRKQMGLVFQNPDDQLFMPFIYDDIAFGCRNYGLSESDINNRIDVILEKLNISHLRNRSSLKLSGGEKRMAAIATVLVMNPTVLLFDEPTAYLDPKAKRALVGVMNNLQHPKIIATHDMSFAAEVCNRVIVLKNGSIMADGDCSLLKDIELMIRCGL